MATQAEATQVFTNIEQQYKDYLAKKKTGAGYLSPEWYALPMPEMETISQEAARLAKQWYNWQTIPGYAQPDIDFIPEYIIPEAAPIPAPSGTGYVTPLEQEPGFVERLPEWLKKKPETTTGVTPPILLTWEEYNNLSPEDQFKYVQGGGLIPSGAIYAPPETTSEYTAALDAYNKAKAEYERLAVNVTDKTRGISTAAYQAMLDAKKALDALEQPEWGYYPEGIILPSPEEQAAYDSLKRINEINSLLAGELSDEERTSLQDELNQLNTSITPFFESSIQGIIQSYNNLLTPEQLAILTAQYVSVYGYAEPEYILSLIDPDKKLAPEGVTEHLDWGDDLLLRSELVPYLLQLDKDYQASVTIQADRQAQFEALQPDIVSVFPEFKNLTGDKLSNALTTLINSYPDAFVNKLRQSGMNEQTTAILNYIYPNISNDEIRGTFGYMALPTYEEWKASMEAPLGKWWWEGTTQADYEKYIADVEDDPWALKALQFGLGSVPQGLSSAASWLGADGIAETLKLYSVPSLMAFTPDDTPGQITWKDVFTGVLQSAPTSILMMAPSLVVGAFTAGVATPFILGTMSKILAGLATGVSGAIPGTIIEAGLEAGQTYDEALKMGMTPQEANDAADQVFKNNCLALGFSNTAQLAVFFLPSLKLMTKAISQGLIRTTTTAAGEIIFQGLTEAGEELWQNKLQREALGQGFEWDEQAQLATLIGGIMGLGFGGISTLYTAITNKTVKNLPPDIRPIVETDIQNNIASGMTEDAAIVAALDKVDSKIVTTAANLAIDEVKIDEYERQIIGEETLKEGYGKRIVRIDDFTPEDSQALKSAGWNIYYKNLYTVYAEGIDYLGLDPSIDSTLPASISTLKIKEIKKLPGLLTPAKSNTPLIPAKSKLSPPGKLAWQKTFNKQRAEKRIVKEIKVTGKLGEALQTKEQITKAYNTELIKAKKAYTDTLRETGSHEESFNIENKIITTAQNNYEEALRQIEKPAPEGATKSLGAAAWEDFYRYASGKKNYAKAQEAIKAQLVDFIKQIVPLEARGKMLDQVKSVKTFSNLESAMQLAQKYAREYYTRTLKAQINKELSRAKPKKKTGILTSRFGGEAQEELDYLRANINADRDAVNERIANNQIAYEKGDMDYEAMVEENIRLNLTGIDGMTVAELRETLAYIKDIKNTGRLKRLEAKEARQKLAKEAAEASSKIISGGKEIVPGEQIKFGMARGFLDKVENGQVALTDFMDRLSSKDKTSKPYQSDLSLYVDNRVHNSYNAEQDGLFNEAAKVRAAFYAIYKARNDAAAEDILRQQGHEEINLGTFTNTEGKSKELKLTKGQMIDIYNLLQAPENLETFKQGNKWTQEMIDASISKLSNQDIAWADWQRAYLSDYWASINKIYEPLYGMKLGKHENYWMLKRDMEKSDISEHILTKQDYSNYASINNGSLKARTNNKIPFEFLNANGKLLNHIAQMEHFKAWAFTIRDLRSLFTNKDVRNAVKQFYGNDVLKIINQYINNLARGGIEKARTVRWLDDLRGKVSVSILGLKPFIGIKQPTALFAFATGMPYSDFISGVAGFLTNPLTNYKILYDKSSTLRARYRAGQWERDIKVGVERGIPKSISGKANWREQILLFIQYGDMYGTVPGMWAKYQSGLKAGLTDAQAIIEAEKLINRTQNTSHMSTLSPLQMGGSYARLLTMFQDQPNKYFRLLNANVRNLVNGREDKAKALTNITILWVLVPALFQFMSDGFRWRTDRQMRAWLLGPVNFLLIFGNVAQSIFGWVTGENYKYEPSPVLQMVDDLQTFISKIMKMIRDGQDPYSDISLDDIFSAIEYLAKAVGYYTGIPTPYLVQIEQAIREGDPLRLVLSKWALEEDNLSNLEKALQAIGLLGTEIPIDEAYIGDASNKQPKIYTLHNLDIELSEIYKRVLPSQIKETTPLVTLWAQAEIVWGNVGVLPNGSLKDLIKPDINGDTFIEYFTQWQMRQKVDNLPDLEEFDKLYPYSYRGNITQKQFDMLLGYINATDRGEYLKAHPELELDLREEYLKSHPDENALLALWGNGKIISAAAYDAYQALITKYSIPAGATADQGILDEVNTADYFNYLAMPNKTTEEQAAKNKFRLEHPELDAMLAFYKQSGKLQSEEAYNLVKERIGLEGISTLDLGLPPDELIDNYFEYNKIADEFGASAQTDLYRLQNPDWDKWGQNNLDWQPLGDVSEEGLKISVKWEDLDDQYDGFGDPASEYFIPDSGEREAATAKLLADNPEYAKDRYRRTAFNFNLPGQYVDNYAEYEMLPGLPDEPPKGIPQNIWDGMPYFEDDWYLLNHYDFYQSMLNDVDPTDRWVIKDSLLKVPTKEVYNLYLQYEAIGRDTSGKIVDSAARARFKEAHPTLWAWKAWANAPSLPLSSYLEWYRLGLDKT